MSPRDERFELKLTRAERRALDILAALGEVSMGEYVRRKAIIAMWRARFGDAPLGRVPNGHKSEKEEDGEDDTDI
jgi:hypothetical protein